MTDVWLVATGRTPFAPRYGALESVHPTELLSAVLTGLTSRTNVAPNNIDELIVGCASPTGAQALTVGRGTALAIGADGLSASTVERGTGSGLAAFRYATALVASGHAEVVMAAGVEHMSRYPAGSAAYEGVGVPVGSAARSRGDVLPSLHVAELMAETVGAGALIGWAQEARAASAAHRSRRFRKLLPLRVADIVVTQDIVEVQDDALPIVTAEGVLTATMIAPMADGAAGALLASSEAVSQFGLTPLARVCATASTAAAPNGFDAVVSAADAAMHAAKVAPEQMEALELDDTTAVLPVWWQAQKITNSASFLNSFGGGIGQGAPLGAHGIRMLDDLIGALHGDGNYGLAVSDDGLGSASAVILQRCE